MVRRRQMNEKDNEAGGQLFAKFEENHTVIVEATEPKPLDKRARYLFIPNRWLQRQEIKTLYNQGKHFVGDWHTHPQPVPSPSADDINGMVDCFRKSRHDLKAFLMVIVGTADPPEGLFVCLVDGNGITRLALTTTSG
jgi:integrative and conjugative element protein (TIGR02256 family)